MSDFSIIQPKQEVFEHTVGQAFKKYPEIYQIEACAACNLACPFCLRTTDMDRPVGLLDIALLKLMHVRGDFQGSAYVELQMAGEPTLHPKLFDIVMFLKHEVGVMVGFSTHGLTIKKAGVLPAILQLDALTVSVDSVDPETYHKMRYPAHFPELLENLEKLFTQLEACDQYGSHRPFVELQLVVTDLVQGSGDVAALASLMKEKGWDRYAQIRQTGDCFYEMQGRKEQGSLTRNSDLCVNPWTSVSVAFNGDVASCCYIFDPKKDEVNFYGNLYEQSLEEIWNGVRVQEMRQQHLTGKLSGQCTSCFLRSPFLIHQNIISRLVRLRSR